ncbi:MAG TPA: hypothetical protein VG820_03970, partial [Fimbriimonadaceae bacterium]|nr:hypothetical protein [Fimbriimonadaceae bacterium]
MISLLFAMSITTHSGSGSGTARLATPMSVLAGQTQEPKYIRLKGPSGEFAIENLSSFSVENPFGPGKATLTGNPVQIFWRDAGMSLTANSVVGETALDSTTGNYYLKSADVSGNATSVFDSEEYGKYFAQRLKESGQPAPPPAVAKAYLKFVSDAYHYSGTYSIGTFALSNSF